MLTGSTRTTCAVNGTNSTSDERQGPCRNPCKSGFVRNLDPVPFSRFRALGCHPVSTLITRCRKEYGQYFCTAPKLIAAKLFCSEKKKEATNGIVNSGTTITPASTP